MATCRFHAHRGAKTYCPSCRAYLCDDCGKSGRDCPLCRGAKLVLAEHGPKGGATPAACANHPTQHAGLKTCQSCNRRFCQACMKFGGICAGCAQAEEQARAGMTAPLPPEEAPRQRRKSMRDDAAVTRKFKKGRQRALVRWGLGGAVVAGLLGLVIADYGMLRHTVDQASSRMRQSRGQDADTVLERLDDRPVSGEDAARLDQMLDRADKGLSPDRGQQDVARRLARPGLPGSAPRRNAHGAPPGLWARLSKIENEHAGAPPPHPAAPPPAPHRPGAPLAVLTRAESWQVGLVGLRAGQKIKGVAAVNARVAGSGLVEHVELQVNGQWQGLCNQLPYRFEWDTRGNPNGPATLRVVVFEPGGKRHASAPIRITIAN